MKRGQPMGQCRLRSVITAGEERPAEMGGAAKLPKILLEPKKVRFTHIPIFCMEFIDLRDDISKRIYGNHKKLRL